LIQPIMAVETPTVLKKLIQRPVGTLGAAW
jgi:hypothetical protein